MGRVLTLCAVGLVLATVAVAGPADSPSITESWSAPRDRARSFSSALVVGITADDTVRRNFENKFVAHLRGRKVECVTSRSIVSDLRHIESPAVVAERLLSHEVDTVITVRLVPAGAAAAETGAKAWREALADEAEVRPYVEAALAEGAGESGKVAVEIRMWDVVTRGLVWAARTEPRTRKNLRKHSGEIIQEVISRMKGDGAL